MKQLTILFLFSMLGLKINAQNQTTTMQQDSTRRKAYDKFVGKVLNLNASAPQTSFLFDITKSPTLKLSLPLIQGNIHQLFLDGNISSTNDYTPLIKKGNWAPDASAGLSYTFFNKRVTKFYTSDIQSLFHNNIEAATIDHASQIFWMWTTIKLGYNYSNYVFYNDSANISMDKRTFEKKYDRPFFKISQSIYFFPSKNKCPWLTVTANLGYQFLKNDNNYSSLKSVNVKSIQTYSDTTGKSVEVILDETTAKKGTFTVTDASIIDFNLMTLFSPTEKFYFGLSVYGKTRITDKIKSTDIGFGITVPIQKSNDDKKTAASFTLKYDIPDVDNQLSTLTLKEKGKLGFTIGVPITTYRPH